MKISNSQIASFQKCQKRFYFEHVLKLRPLEYPEAMTRGLDGHLMMEAFFTALIEGKSYDECTEAVNSVLLGMPPSSLSVYRHVLAFGAYFCSQPWKPILVEANHIADTATGEFAFTPDLAVEWTEGIKRGQQFLLDYKFTGQYWTDREVALSQQLPKYVIYLNKAGYKINNAGLVMLNTRAAAGATGTNLFLIKWLPLNKQKLATIKADNEEMIRQTSSAKQFWTPEKFRRTVDQYACKMCVFGEDLCPADLEGRETKRIIERNYVVNDYFDQYEVQENTTYIDGR